MMDGYLNLLSTEVEELRHAMYHAYKRGDRTEARRALWMLQGVRQARNLALIYIAVRGRHAA